MGVKPPGEELVDSLTLTQYLLMETLAARWRLGEDFWTFPNRSKPCLRQLENKGLVWWQGGVAEGTVVASMTHTGMKTFLSPDNKTGRQVGDDEHRWRIAGEAG